MSERQIRLLAELTEKEMNLVVKKYELVKEQKNTTDYDLNEELTHAIYELKMAIKLLDDLRVETNTMDQFD